MLACEVLDQMGFVIEAHLTHAALWMAPWTLVIALSKVALKLRWREQMLLARESLAMLQANVTHLQLVSAYQVGL